jgi:hypothetical protein
MQLVDKSGSSTNFTLESGQRFYISNDIFGGFESDTVDFLDALASALGPPSSYR